MPLLPKRSPEPKSESVVQSEIRKALGSLPDVRLWRNNTGSIKDTRGVPVKFGLCVGSSDLLCIVAPRGRWLVIECKSEDWVPAKSGVRWEHEEEQRMFIGVIESMGGVGGFARSVSEAMGLVEKARHAIAQTPDTGRLL